MHVHSNPTASKVNSEMRLSDVKHMMCLEDRGIMVSRKLCPVFEPKVISWNDILHGSIDRCKTWK